jgi:hypothetical protein
MREVNSVLWVSLILIAWGIGRGIYDVSTGEALFRTPDGGTLLLLGILFGSVGQALFRLQARLIFLESRKSTQERSPS